MGFYGFPFGGIVWGAAILLSTGKVLATNVGNSTTCELYDPGAGTWSPTGSSPVILQYTSLVDLGNGYILSVGYDNSGAQTGCYLYNVVGGTWASTGSLNNATMTDETAAYLSSNGSVYAITNANVGNLHMEEYDIGTGLWTDLGQILASTGGFDVELVGIGTDALLFKNGQTSVYRWNATGNTLNSGVAVGSTLTFAGNQIASVNTDGDVVFVPSGNATTVLKYNIGSDTITSLASLPAVLDVSAGTVPLVWIAIASDSIIAAQSNYGAGGHTYQYVAAATTTYGAIVPPALSVDPQTPATGAVWFNTSSHKWKGFDGSSVVTFTTTP